jgi:hypothetical protein
MFLRLLRLRRFGRLPREGIRLQRRLQNGPDTPLIGFLRTDPY